MRKTLFIMIFVLIFSFVGCSTIEEEQMSEEEKRIQLYIKAMEGAYNEENGGNGFIAIRTDTLEGLSQEGIEEVLTYFKSISDNVYPFSEVENDETKFEKDDRGNLVTTINGSLLFIDLDSYSEKKAVITGVSWFGNLGAIFPKYEAKFKNNQWQLELISMAIS